MKNKILIVLAWLLITTVVIVRYKFKQKLEQFKTEIARYESNQLENFRNEKDNMISTLLSGDNRLYKLFTNQFDESKSISERDTTFSFLYLNETIKFKVASLQYLECLNSKCVIDEQNEVAQNLIDEKLEELQIEYGETFSLWYSTLKNEKLLKQTNKAGDCNLYFPNMNEIIYDENIWSDFENFLIAYNTEANESIIQNEQIEYEYSLNVNSAKSKLRSNMISYFYKKLSDSKSQILSSQPETKCFNSPTLGNISFTVQRTIFDKQAFQSIADETYKEQWKTNSLFTGAMPYASCFGSSNSCDYYGCSRITVLTGNTDAIVTVKGRSGNVVRHGYISSGESYSFNLPDGTYQVFFYSGSGWNPNKEMYSNSCETLYGGFVANEEVTKVSFHTLVNQEWTIELILQENGNLQTLPSSKTEAL